MNTGPVQVFSPPTELQVDQGGVRSQGLPLPGSGSVLTGEISNSQNSPPVFARPPDEVKVQFEPPGEITVYQFVDQYGDVILQVPTQQLLNLARQIAQELAEEAAPVGSAGGKDNGH